MRVYTWGLLLVCSGYFRYFSVFRCIYGVGPKDFGLPCRDSANGGAGSFGETYYC